MNSWKYQSIHAQFHGQIHGTMFLFCFEGHRLIDLKSLKHMAVGQNQ